MNQEFEYYPPKIEEERETQQNKIYQILESISSKYSAGGAQLKVYVDAEEKKYYITIFAASALEFITYAEAVKLSESGQEFFEITPEVLHILNVIFKGRIVYEQLPPKKISDKEGELDYKNYSDDDSFSKYDNHADNQEYIELLNSNQNFYNNRLR